MGVQTQAGCDDQSEVIDFLSDPASYPGRLDRIDRLETHGALVFLAGDHAWKIKRAVRFSYLDFSTLAKRKAVCEREVDVNRPRAPEIYLGCEPITRKPDGHLTLGGSGEVVEWAVHMRRFDQSALLIHTARFGPLAPDLARDLADVVYASHVAAVRAPGEQAALRFEKIVADVSASLAALRDVFTVTDVEQFRSSAAEQMRRSAPVLDARASAGFIRRCHGDLHLANIVLWHRRPMLFDAIEFDEDLATVDTLYDLAFLLMDLDRGGQRRAANGILNRYLWRSGEALDLQGLQALPLFLGLRAAIRAMVMGQQANQAEGERKDRIEEGARRYLTAALAYLEPPPARLIAVAGLSGTGKSTLAFGLAPHVGATPGAAHLRSDLERKSLYGVEETVRLGPEAYTKEANDKVYAVLMDKTRQALAAGHAVIVDAVYSAPEERSYIESVATGLAVPFQGLWLEAPPRELVERVATRTGDASDATPDVVEQQLVWETGTLGPAWVSLDSSGTPEQTLQSARELLTLRLIA